MDAKKFAWGWPWVSGNSCGPCFSPIRGMMYEGQ